VTGVFLTMKPNWTLRQILALLRGLALIVGLLWALFLVQIIPALLGGGVSGVRELIARAAIAGVPQEHWDTAISRMYLLMGATLVFGLALYIAQRYLGRKLGGRHGAPGQS